MLPRFLTLLIVVLIGGGACSFIEIEYGPTPRGELLTAPASDAVPDSRYDQVPKTPVFTEKPSNPSIRDSPGAMQVAGIPATLEAVAKTIGLHEDTPSLSVLKEHMLGLINSDRQAHGLDPVVLGDITASQRHAEDLLAHNYRGHWGRDGLKPYMRYTLAGGVDAEHENVSAPAFRKEGVRYAKRSPKESLRISQEGLINSPGHRRNILGKWHKKVNLGIACDQISCAVVQQFQGDYVEFYRKPDLLNRTLRIEGELKDGFKLSGVQVWYDPLPHPLTLGQLDATYSYFLGWPAVFLRPPLPESYQYPDSNSTYNFELGVDPYEVDPRTPRLTPDCQNGDCQRLPKLPVEEISVVVPRVTAEIWESSGGLFRVVADISPIVDALDHGIYTVMIWGDKDGESVALTRYAIFVE